MSLSSISAKKLSDGAFVIWMSVATRGELTVASSCAEPGVAWVYTCVPFGTLTPAARSAATNCWAANSAGRFWTEAPAASANPRSYARPLSSPSMYGEKANPVATVPRSESSTDSSPTIDPWIARIGFVRRRFVTRRWSVAPVPAPYAFRS